MWGKIRWNWKMIKFDLWPTGRFRKNLYFKQSLSVLWFLGCVTGILGEVTGGSFSLFFSLVLTKGDESEAVEWRFSFAKISTNHGAPLERRSYPKHYSYHAHATRQLPPTHSDTRQNLYWPSRSSSARNKKNVISDFLRPHHALCDPGQGLTLCVCYI